MVTVILLVFLLFSMNTASRLERLSTAVFNLTKGGIERIMRPLTTLSRTEDTFRGSLRSSNGSNIAVNILGNTGGRLPYSVFGSAAEGGSLDFFGRIVSSIQPYLLPFRVVRTRKSGNSSALVWSTSEEHKKKR